MQLGFCGDNVAVAVNTAIAERDRVVGVRHVGICPLLLTNL
jgi:hypothetical protein